MCQSSEERVLLLTDNDRMCVTRMRNCHHLYCAICVLYMWCNKYEFNEDKFDTYEELMRQDFECAVCRTLTIGIPHLSRRYAWNMPFLEDEGTKRIVNHVIERGMNAMKRSGLKKEACEAWGSLSLWERWGEGGTIEKDLNFRLP